MIHEYEKVRVVNNLKAYLNSYDRYPSYSKIYKIVMNNFDGSSTFSKDRGKFVNKLMNLIQPSYEQVSIQNDLMERNSEIDKLVKDIEVFISDKNKSKQEYSLYLLNLIAKLNQLQR